MGTLLGLPVVVAEAITPTYEPGGHVTTMLILIGTLFGVCFVGALLVADPVDDL
jgi:hypothetical protein